MRVEADAAALHRAIEVVARVRPPTVAELDAFRLGQTLISFFHPAQNAALLEEVRSRRLNNRPEKDGPPLEEDWNGRL